MDPLQGKMANELQMHATCEINDWKRHRKNPQEGPIHGGVKIEVPLQTNA